MVKNNNIDVIYTNLVDKVLYDGVSTKGTGKDVRTKYEDGREAHYRYMFGEQVRMHHKIDDVPLLKSKYVAWKWAIIEMLWIWLWKTNDVEKLKEHKVSIWNEWQKEDGTIGTAYGWINEQKWYQSNGQMVDQVDYLLQNLKQDPLSRRHLTTIYIPEYIQSGSLAPCVWSSQWNVNAEKNELDLMVNQRSVDLALGFPFNIFQYYVLQKLVAHHVGLECGELIWNLGNYHVYDDHIPLLSEQLGVEVPNQKPELVINFKDNIYDYTPDDFKVVNYEHNGKFSFDVAI